VLAQQTSEEQTPHPPAAQHAPGYQQAQEPTILAAPFLLIFAFVFILVPTLATFTEEMSKEQTPYPPPPQHSTAD
jgi:hypothetical protein